MNPRKNLAPEFAALCERLEGAAGKKYWRSLEELADSSAFQELMRQEFPQQALEEPGQLSRRQFLTLMGASLALAGVAGCSVRPAPSRTLVPYVKAPEEIIPGRPLFYATSMTLGGCGVGLLVESHLGRPTKVEGNPDHPASLGATDPYHQASVLGLYDPDRSQTVTHLGQTATWEAGLRALGAAVEKQRAGKGAGLRLLTETVVSPTLGGQIERFLKQFPEAKWHQYEPLARDSAYRAAIQAFGEPVATRYDFTKADVVLSLDADFFAHGPGSLRYVADFMARRRVRTTAEDAGDARMNRLYVVETSVSITGAKADHRLALPAGQIEGLAHAVASALGVAGAVGGKGEHGKWANAVAADLQGHRGRCVVIAGDRQPAAVHLLAHAMNERLGNRGQTVLLTDPVEARPADHAGSLRELADDMGRRRVESLVILGGNPVFTAPADLQFGERMQRVPFRAHLSLYQDETSRQCQWHFPEAHYLESWGDTRAFDGTASLAQPLIEPLYRGRSSVELMAALSGEPRPGLEIVKDHWREQHAARKSAGDFETFWQTSLHDGVIADTRLAPRTAPFAAGWEKHLAPAAPPAKGTGAYELVFQHDPTIYDGRFANNGWLQELPKPITRLTWDNAALMSPATAKELGVALGGYAHGGEHGGFHQPVVELRLGERTVSAPAWVVPGHADGSITLTLGYGRTAAGRVGGSDGSVGSDAYALRTSDRPWFASGAMAGKTSRTYLLACTQEHQSMENRELVRSADLDEYHRRPDFATRAEEEELRKDLERIGEDPRPRPGRVALRLYDGEDKPASEHRWGMSIDLTTCIGCNTCVVACQAENNIPVVGKEQVAAGREMHWLRVDRYNSGPFDAPTEFHFQPVPCMHCEDAPCEYVCPVEATVHSADGLNDMVYQRCVGTRFCSNNCPYKVRRFNFFHYADYATESLRQQYNPDVTVRSRGVMEKCSYCVQRIRHADIDAQREHRPVADGEILTACQSACPAKAISFGDLNDKASEVTKWKDTPLSYALLADLNTKPRTTYLAALRNPNPALKGE